MHPLWLLIVVCGAFGLAIGSFLNVVIYRVPCKESIVTPPSGCPSGGTDLAARDNIPVLSWVLLRGKCRTCGAPISWRYPAVELLTAGLLRPDCTGTDTGTEAIAGGGRGAGKGRGGRVALTGCPALGEADA